MDINDLRSISTVLAFATFVGLVVWVYSAKRKDVMDEIASQIISDDDDVSRGNGSADQQIN